MRKYRVISKVDRSGNVCYYPQHFIGIGKFGLWWDYGHSDNYAHEGETQTFDELGDACAYIKDKEDRYNYARASRVENKHLHNKVHECCK